MIRRYAGYLLLLAMLAGCGQTGPLYLPDTDAAQPVPVQVPTTTGGDAAAPAAAPAPAADIPAETGAAPEAPAVPDKTNEPRRRAH